MSKRKLSDEELFSPFEHTLRPTEVCALRQAPNLPPGRPRDRPRYGQFFDPPLPSSQLGFPSSRASWGQQTYKPSSPVSATDIRSGSPVYISSSQTTHNSSLVDHDASLVIPGTMSSHTQGTALMPPPAIPTRSATRALSHAMDPLMATFPDTPRSSTTFSAGSAPAMGGSLAMMSGTPMRDSQATTSNFIDTDGLFEPITSSKRANSAIPTDMLSDPDDFVFQDQQRRSPLPMLEGVRFDAPNTFPGGEVEAEDAFAHAGLTREDTAQITAILGGCSADDVLQRIRDEGDAADDHDQMVNSSVLETDYVNKVAPQGRYSRQDACSEYRQCLRQGRLHLASKLLQHEQHATALRGGNEHTLLLKAYNILLSISDVLLQTMANGTFAVQAHDNDEIVLILEEIKAQAFEKGHPVIYVQSFVEQDGKAPLVHDMKQILADVKMYIAPNHEFDNVQSVLAIDEFRREHTWMKAVKKGVRKYLTYKDPVEPNLPIESRVATARLFCHELRNELDRLARQNPNSEQTLRMEGPITEVGVTGRARERDEEHQAHINSNFLMNLCHAVAEFRNPRKYKVDFRCVYLISQPNLANLAEVIISRLFQAQILNGYGFNWYPPGLSCSLGKRSPEQLRSY